MSHAAVIQAASKLLGNLAVKNPVQPGVYNLDGQHLILELSGSVRKGEDYDYTPTCSIPIIPALMLAFEKAGIVGPHLENMLFEAMEAALNADEQANSRIKERLKDVEAAERRVRARLAELPKQKADGPFRLKVAGAEKAEIRGYRVVTAEPIPA